MKFLQLFVPRRLSSLLLALAVAGAPAAHAASQSHTNKQKAAAKKAKAKKPAPRAVAAKTAASKAAREAIKRTSNVNHVGEQVNFREWSAVQQFAGEMVAKHGFERAWLDGLIGQLQAV